MSLREIKFSPVQGVETILYLASRLADPTIHEILKLRYFADKLHLSSYGYLASGDDYVAMQFGPVASGTYNLMRAARGDQSGWIHPELAAAVRGAFSVRDDRKTLQMQRGADLDKLSKAEVACLDEAIKCYGNMKFAERTELSHDAAWQEANKAAAADEVGASPMPIEAIARTLTNGGEVIGHLRS